MKKYLFSLLAIISCISVNAEIKSSLKDAFAGFVNSSTPSHDPSRLWKSFLKDTLMFNFSDAYIRGFTMEKPDTVWLKKRPKKNPVLGKHYILNNVYKGELIDNSYITPASAVNDKPFLLYQYKAYSGGSGCTLTLMDPDNLELISFDLPNAFPHDAVVRSLKAERIINDYINHIVYYAPEVSKYSSSTPKFEKAEVKGGDFKIKLTKNNSGRYGHYNVNVSCVIRVKRADNEIINYYPLQSSSSSYTSKNPVILSQADYDAQFKEYTINSDVDMEILGWKNDFPFSFKVIPALTKYTYPSVCQTISPRGMEGLKATLNNRMITIGDIFSIGGTDYYKASFNGKAFFIRQSDVSIDDETKMLLDTLKAQPQAIRDEFFLYQLALNRAMYLNKLEDAIKQIKSYSKYGLGIESAGVYDMSEYTDGTGYKVRFYNPTDQMIKYISFTLQGYNAVDDPCGIAITKRCIGPIEPDESATYDFEYLWFTDVVEYARMRTIKVTYKNGTTKTISNANSIFMPEELWDIVYDTDPVEKLN